MTFNPILAASNISPLADLPPERKKEWEPEDPLKQADEICADAEGTHRNAQNIRLKRVVHAHIHLFPPLRKRRSRRRRRIGMYYIFAGKTSKQSASFGSCLELDDPILLWDDTQKSVLHEVKTLYIPNRHLPEEKRLTLSGRLDLSPFSSSASISGVSVLEPNGEPRFNGRYFSFPSKDFSPADVARIVSLRESGRDMLLVWNSDHDNLAFMAYWQKEKNNPFSGFDDSSQKNWCFPKAFDFETLNDVLHCGNFVLAQLECHRNLNSNQRQGKNKAIQNHETIPNFNLHDTSKGSILYSYEKQSAYWLKEKKTILEPDDFWSLAFHDVIGDINASQDFKNMELYRVIRDVKFV